MLSKLLSILLIGIAILFAVAIWFVYQGHKIGYSAKTEPHALEAFVARHLRMMAIPRAQRDKANPVGPTPDVLAHARAHFADHCAICHANDGSGKTAIGENVYPRVPDLRRPATQSMSDGELFFIIHNGVRFTAMPAWGTGNPDEDLDSWKLVHFIRSLPDLTPADLEEMKALNPKTKHQLEEEAAADRFLKGEDAAGAPPMSGHHHH